MCWMGSRILSRAQGGALTCARRNLRLGAQAEGPASARGSDKAQGDSATGLDKPQGENGSLGPGADAAGAKAAGAECGVGAGQGQGQRQGQGQGQS